MERKIAALFLMILSAGNLSLMASGSGDSETGLSVVATTSMITDVVRNIAGGNMDIYGLLKEGQNPHSYSPTPRDMARVEKADLLFVNGFDLEENLLHDLENASLPGTRIVEVSSTIVPVTSDHHDEEDEHHHAVDPHTWMSPLNGVKWTDVVVEALSEADPANRDQYWTNGEAYKAKLMEEDRKIREIMDRIPVENRIIITDHNIFGYMSRDYGITVLGSFIPGFSTNSEISPGALAELIRAINENKVKAFYIGVTADDAVRKLSSTIQKELDYPVQVLPILTGALAPAGEQGDTYLGFLRYNMEQLEKGLGQ